MIVYYNIVGALTVDTSVFGGGVGQIWLYSVQCAGSESRLVECVSTSQATGNYRCDHSQDAGVRCLDGNG